MTTKRIDKQALRNQLHEAYRKYHDLKQRQLYLAEDNPAAAKDSEGFQELAKGMADELDKISRLKKELGIA